MHSGESGFLICVVQAGGITFKFSKNEKYFVKKERGYSYSAAPLTSSRGTPVAEHWSRHNKKNF